MKFLSQFIIVGLMVLILPTQVKAFFDYQSVKNSLENEIQTLNVEFNESKVRSQNINQSFYSNSSANKLDQLKTEYLSEQKVRELLQTNLIPKVDRLKALSYNENDFKNLNLDVPFFKQQKKLSCEIATLRMSLGFFGIDIPEIVLENSLDFSITGGPINGIWGDPNLGFVGNINGYQSSRNLTGYGVHWGPLTKLAQKYRPDSYAFENGTIDLIVQELYLGHPIIAWGINDISQPIKELHWKTPEGKEITGYERQHTWVIKGFTGTLKNPENFIVLNPLSGERKVSVKDFANHWKYFNYSGVVVR